MVAETVSVQKTKQNNKSKRYTWGGRGGRNWIFSYSIQVKACIEFNCIIGTWLTVTVLILGVIVDCPLEKAWYISS